MFNLDFSKRVVINSDKLEWINSPSAGVLRKPLARSEQINGHITSIVSYAPGSNFSEHKHPFGEEIYVLEGVFSDETGDYPKGSYIRNPPGSKHKPFSVEGCVIFVKLNQFNSQDLLQVNINCAEIPWLAGVGELQVKPLHSFETEGVALVKWPANETFQPHRHFGGEEVLVLSGEFKDEHGVYPTNTWIRSPHLSEHFPYVTQETVILVKTGHLPLSH